MAQLSIDDIFVQSSSDTVAIRPVTKDELAKADDGRAAQWANATGFKAKAGDVLIVPSESGSAIGEVLLGLGEGNDPLCAGALKALPDGDYDLQPHDRLDRHLALIGFGLGIYRFETYTKPSPRKLRLVWDKSDDRAVVQRALNASWLARDLVNTPANDMGPDKIEAAATRLARQFKATIKVTSGDDLLKKNLPMVHAVGRASTVPPRLIDFSWGKKSAPKLTLVGKGVAYDTGGLNIKPGSSMRNMKKDMGGAAHVLALAQMIMDAKLNVRLRVLIPAVENAIAGNAFRPGDVLQSRKGLTVEIGNTDAEGRLVLADALALADEDKPDHIIDMATLTGAARVALGPDIPPFYTTDDAFAEELMHHSATEHDPIWRMPLWDGYAKGLQSTVADMCNITSDGFAGSVTAALFLKRFVEASRNWTHFDIFAWSTKAKPHASVGGEAQAIRALFAALQERYR